MAALLQYFLKYAEQSTQGQSAIRRDASGAKLNHSQRIFIQTAKEAYRALAQSL